MIHNFGAKDFFLNRNYLESQNIVVSFVDFEI